MLTTTRFSTAAAFALAVTATAITGTVVSADSVEPSARTCFAVAGAPGDAAIVNLTPTGAVAGGNGQLVSSTTTNPPVFSNVNFTETSVDPNVAIARIGTDGEVCFVNNGAGRVGLVADHLGTIDASSYTPATTSGAPTRAVDTRSGLGGPPLASGARVCFDVAGDPGDAAIVNLTPIRAAGTGNGKLVSSDTSNPPVFSNVNYTEGSVDPNIAVARIGADGRVCYVNGAETSADLVADHIGTIDAASYTPATTSGAPTRAVDTRTSLGGSRLGSGERLCFGVAGSPGDTAFVNLTPVRAGGAGFGQLVSSDATNPPVFSNVNFTFGSVDPNVAIASIGSDGEVCYVNSGGASVDLIADHIGTVDAAAYSAATADGSPDRVLDSRTTASRADLVLRAAGVGNAAFGRDPASSIAYVESGLGPAVFDRVTSFPVDEGAAGFRTDDGGGDDSYFAFPVARQVGFDNGFELTFGGSTSTELRLVGWSQNGFYVVGDTLVETVTAPLRTRDGVTLGSRGSDHPASIVVDEGGCFTVGTGSTNGVSLVLESDGIPFLEIIGTGPGFRVNTPPLDDVTVLALSAGQQVVPFGDC